MRRVILAGIAGLALMAAQPAHAQVFNWSGFYTGVHVGVDWFHKDWFIPATPLNLGGGCAGCPIGSGGHSDTSWLAGGQIGFNHQVGTWVWGVEAQFSWTRLEGANPNALSAVITNHSKTDWMGTLAARFGMASGMSLFYGKLGAAFAGDRFWTSTAAFPVAQRATDTRTGWMVGLGFEQALPPPSANWSWKVEYDYLWFARKRETVQPTPACIGCGAFDYDILQSIHLIKFGLNYRFG